MSRNSSSQSQVLRRVKNSPKERQTKLARNHTAASSSSSSSLSKKMSLELFDAYFNPNTDALNHAVKGDSNDGCTIPKGKKTRLCDSDTQRKDMARKQKTNTNREIDPHMSPSHSSSNGASSSTNSNYISDLHHDSASAQNDEVKSEGTSRSSDFLSSSSPSSSSSPLLSENGPECDDESQRTIQPMSMHISRKVSDEPQPYMNVVWTDSEQKLLDDAMKSFPEGVTGPLLRYLKIASMIGSKSTRDVALRIHWLDSNSSSKKQSSNRRRQKAKNTASGIKAQKENELEQPTDSADTPNQYESASSIFRDPVEHTQLEKIGVDDAIQAANKLMADNECILQEIAFLQSKEDSLSIIIELMSKFKVNVAEVERHVTQISLSPMPNLPPMADLELPSHLANSFRINTSLI